MAANTYRIYFNLGASSSVEVEADTLEEAIDLAEPPNGVCAQCSGWGRNWDLDLGDPDLDETAVEVNGKFLNNLNDAEKYDVEKSEEDE